MNIDAVAQICHETNRAYCNTLGDLMPMPWAIAAEWQKQSALEGVRFRLKHPEASPRKQHENWLRLKQKEGWRYGPVRRPEMKEHPCCVSFDALPPEQQLKDALFRAVVNACRPYLRIEEGAAPGGDVSGAAAAEALANRQRDICKERA